MARARMRSCPSSDFAIDDELLENSAFCRRRRLDAVLFLAGLPEPVFRASSNLCSGNGTGSARAARRRTVVASRCAQDAITVGYSRELTVTQACCFIGNAASTCRDDSSRSPSRSGMVCTTRGASSDRSQDGLIQRGCQYSSDCASEAKTEAASDAFLLRYGGRLRGGARDDSEGSDVVHAPGPSEAPERKEDEYKQQQLAALRAALVRSLTVVEGIVDGGHYLPVFYTLKDVLHLSPAQLSLMMGLSSLPWSCKPLRAMITDRFPGGQLRSPYLVVGFLTIGSTFVALTTVHTYWPSLFLLSLNTLGRCLVGGVLQALVVELARPEGHGGVSRIVGDVSLLKTSGALIGVFVSGRIIDVWGPRFVLRTFGSLLPAAMLIAVSHYEMLVKMIFHDETRSVAAPSVSVPSASAPAVERSGNDPSEQPPVSEGSTSVLSELSSVFCEPAVSGPLAFLIMYASTPGYDSSLFYFYVDTMKFPPSMLGSLRTMQELAKLLGIFLYRYGLRHLSDRHFLLGVTAMSFPLYLTPLLLTTGFYKRMHVKPRLLALSGELVRDTFTHMQYMPAIVRAIEFCPPGLEGTVSAIVGSSTHLARGVNLILSAGMARAFGVTSQDFSHLSALILVCGCLSMSPIAISHLLFRNDEVDVACAGDAVDDAVNESSDDDGRGLSAVPAG